MNNVKTLINVLCENNLPNVKEILNKSPELINSRDEQEEDPIIFSVIKNISLEALKVLVNDYKLDINSIDKNGATILHYASAANKIEMVEYLLKENLNINSVDVNGASILHYAAAGNKLETVEFLLKKGLHVKEQDKDGNIPFFFAVKSGKLDVVIFLLHSAISHHDLELLKSYLENFKLDQHKLISSNKKTLLHMAAEIGDENIAKYLIEDYKMNVSTLGSNGYNALHFAASHDRLEVVKLLKNYVVDFDSKISSGKTSYHLAAIKNSVKSLKYMLASQRFSGNWFDLVKSAITNDSFEVVQLLYKEYKLELEKMRFSENINPLHIAAEHGSERLVKYLAATYDIQSKTNDQKTLLHFASMSESTGLIDFLVSQYEFDPNEKDQYGNTAMHYAAQLNRIEAIEFFKKVQGNFEIQNDEGETVAQHAAKFGRDNVLELLLEEYEYDDKKVISLIYAAMKGQDNMNVIKFLTEKFKNKIDLTKLKDEEGITLLHLAAEAGNMEMIEELISKYTLDPYAKTKQGWTMYHFAAKAGQLEVMKYCVNTLKFSPNDRVERRRSVISIMADEGQISALASLVKISEFNTPDLRDSREPEISSQDLIKLKTEKKNLEAEKKNLEAEKKNLEAEKKNLEAEKKNLKTEKENLEAEKENLEAEKENLEAEKKNLEAEKKNLKTENEILKTENEIFKIENDFLEKNLNVSVTPLSAQNSQLHNNAEDKVVQNSNILKNAKIGKVIDASKKGIQGLWRSHSFNRKSSPGNGFLNSSKSATKVEIIDKIPTAPSKISFSAYTDEHAR